MKPVIYVVANKGLSMSPGKLAAQVGHAVAGVFAGYQPANIPEDDPFPSRFRGSPAVAWEAPHQWLIVLEGQDGEHLFWISEYLRSRNIKCHRVVDEGVNEVRPFSLTALGVEILDKDSPEAAYLSGLKQYRALQPCLPYFGSGLLGMRRCEYCDVKPGEYHRPRCEVNNVILCQ